MPLVDPSAFPLVGKNPGELFEGPGGSIAIEPFYTRIYLLYMYTHVITTCTCDSIICIQLAVYVKWRCVVYTVDDSVYLYVSSLCVPQLHFNCCRK